MFTETARDTATPARTGRLNLAHGTVATPVFMPVGTHGTVKALEPDILHAMGYRLILANTYHLYLRPGMDVMRTHKGLHAFSTWQHNILTDSGGFQVFSLAQFRTISDHGVTFKSHIDGSSHTLTPESIVDIQRDIGSDIQMVLDVCTGPEVSRKEAEDALKTTTAWARRAREQWRIVREESGYRGDLFPIVQGNFHRDLRKLSVEQTIELDLPGIAIGGLSVGEPFPVFRDILHYTMELLPHHVPRYVMGIGTPEYILAAIAAGVDMFDCVLPTRAGRTGTLYTTEGRKNVKNARFAHDDDPPDPLLDSFGGRQYSMGYLRHLFQAKEILGSILATRHNLRFLKWLVDEAALAIQEGRFAAFHAHMAEVYPEKS
jgi:queuine tRNA-ribosyltransferase